MALVLTLLTSAFNQTNASSFATASVTPSANALILLAVKSRATGAAPTYGATPVSGNGLTWVSVAEITYQTVGTPLEKLTVFRAMGASPTAGAITITFSGAVSHCAHAVVQVTGTDTTGTNGSGAIVQSATNRADNVASLLVTLGSAITSGNGMFAAFGSSGVTEAQTPDTGYNEPSEVIGTGTASDSGALQTQCHTTPPDNSVQASSASATAERGGIAIEIKAAASGTTFNDSVTEAVTAADAETGSLAAGGLRTDSLAASDSPTATSVTGAACADSLTAADTQTGGIALSVARADTLAASDAQSASLTRAGAVAEALSATDSQVGGIALAAAVSESLTPVDSETGIIALTGAVADTLTASAAQTGALGGAGTRTESLTAAEAESATASLGVARAESVTASDAQAATVSYGVAAAEAVTVADAPDATAELSATWADSLTAVDTIVEGAVGPPEITLLGIFTQVVAPVDLWDATPSVTLTDATPSVRLSLSTPAPHATLGTAPVRLTSTST